MDQITLATISVIAGYALGKVDRLIALLWSRCRLLKRLREKALSLNPKEFVPPSCQWSYNDQNMNIDTEERLKQFWQMFCKCEARVLVITGMYGMGKTFLARRLLAMSVNKFSIKRVKPVYVECQDIRSRFILSEVERLLSKSLDVNKDHYSIQKLIKDRRGLFIFDALDQLTYLEGKTNYLDAIINLTKEESKNKYGARIVLVTRQEFIEYMRSLGRYLKDDLVIELNVHGFQSEAQLKAALSQHADGDSSGHMARITELITKDPSYREFFARPVTLTRFASIKPERIQTMSSTGTTIGSIYRLSFEELSEVDQLCLEQLAYKMFSNKRYDVHISDVQLKGEEETDNQVQQLVVRTGVLSTSWNLCKFTHATFRDYFVAAKLIRSIHQGDAKFISEMKTNYLVSEFVASLLDNETVIRMLSLVTPESDSASLINVMDILSELEEPELIKLSKEYFKNELVRVKNMPMNEYKIDLYVNAGILGFAKEIDDVISYVCNEGIQTFLQNCMASKDDYAYYNGSQDCCEDEWANAAAKRKYGETRRLMAFLLGEMRSIRSLDKLEEIVRNTKEDPTLRTAAEAAIRKIAER